MEYHARQGEVSFFRIDGDLPDWPELAREGGNLIVGHSETGHHHVIERPEAVRIVARPGDAAIRVLRMIVREPTRCVHLRPYDQHRPVDLPPGLYEVRGQREHDPYAALARKVMD